MTTPRQQIWMDSGAFSAFTLGEQQDLAAYCGWVKKHAAYIDHYAVLDVIGSAEGTWDNQRRMEDLGTKPVPCYHYGEDPKWLIKYLERGDQYIALGGMVPITTAQLRPWLDELWDHYLTDAQGRPIVRIHGFGLTTFELMERYPWFSVDSSSWLQSGAFGLILYVSPDGVVTRVCVSDSHPRSGDKGQHYLTETPANQAVIRHQIEARGISMEAVLDHYISRHECNIIGYMDYARLHGTQPFRNPERGLFDAPVDKRTGLAVGWPWPQLQMFFAGDVGLPVEAHFHKHGANRMFTYHLLKQSNIATWRATMDVRDGKPFPAFTFKRKGKKS